MARHTRIPTLMLALGLIIPLAACGADTGARDTMDGLAKAVNAHDTAAIDRLSPGTGGISALKPESGGIRDVKAGDVKTDKDTAVSSLSYTLNGSPALTSVTLAKKDGKWEAGPVDGLFAVYKGDDAVSGGKTLKKGMLLYPGDYRIDYSDGMLKGTIPLTARPGEEAYADETKGDLTPDVESAKFLKTLRESITGLKTCDTLSRLIRNGNDNADWGTSSNCDKALGDGRGIQDADNVTAESTGPRDKDGYYPITPKGTIEAYTATYSTHADPAGDASGWQWRDQQEAAGASCQADLDDRTITCATYAKTTVDVTGIAYAYQTGTFTPATDNDYTTLLDRMYQGWKPTA